MFVQTGGGLGGSYAFAGGAGGVTLASADGQRVLLLGLAGRTRYQGIAAGNFLRQDTPFLIRISWLPRASERPVILQC